MTSVNLENLTLYAVHASNYLYDEPILKPYCRMVGEMTQYLP